MDYEFHNFIITVKYEKQYNRSDPVKILHSNIPYITYYSQNSLGTVGTHNKNQKTYNLIFDFIVPTLSKKSSNQKFAFNTHKFLVSLYRTKYIIRY